MSSDKEINTPQGTASKGLAAIAGLDLENPSLIFATFPDPAMVVNGQGRVVSLNPAAEDLLGFSLSGSECTLSCGQRNLT